MMMVYSGAMGLSFDCASAVGDIIVEGQSNAKYIKVIQEGLVILDLWGERAPLRIRRLDGEKNG